MARVYKWAKHYDDFWFINGCGGKYKSNVWEGRSHYMTFKRHQIPLIAEKIGDINNGMARPRKGQGGNITTDNEIISCEYNDFIPPYTELNELFVFDYNRLIDISPDITFNSLFNREYNCNFYNFYDNELYKKFVYDIKHTLNLNKINYILQKISAYLLEIQNSDKLFDGSTVVRLGMILKWFYYEGVIDTDYDRFNKITTDELNEYENRLFIFILTQCFTFKDKYINLCNNGVSIDDWHPVHFIRRRLTNKCYNSRGRLICYDKDGFNLVHKKYIKHKNNND